MGVQVGEHLIVNIKPVGDPHEAANELIKYMLKDITASGAKLDPALFARVYEALAKRRMRQPSRGFMGLDEKVKPCCECGAVLPKRVRVVSNSETKPKKDGAE